MSEKVILVDEQDKEMGLMPKLQAHELGALHRAFSVFIFNSRGEMLLQQRAEGKYHSAGLWSNACCSHPRPGEDIKDAVARRLQEEMGMSCPVTEVFSFVYKAYLGNGLTEYEYDHVFTGVCDDAPVPDKQEVQAWKYLAEEDLLLKVKATPDRYTAWFKLCLRDRRKELYNNEEMINSGI